MDVSSYIESKFVAARCTGRSRILIGICGRAGSGKTTLAKDLARSLRESGLQSVIYSGDWRFIHDSATRKHLLQERWKVGLSEYLYSLNQFSWWEFDAIYRDVRALLEGRAVRVEGAYDRSTGKHELSVSLPALKEGIIILENCILGGVEFLKECNVILVVNTPDSVCFERIMRKDLERRSMSEVASRYLVTSYSENQFFKVLDKFPNTIIGCTDQGALGSLPAIQKTLHVPVPTELFMEVEELMREHDERTGPTPAGDSSDLTRSES